MYVESVGVPNAGIPATGTKMVSATSSNTKIVENADGESQNSKINSEPAKPAAVVFDTNNDKRVSEEKKLPDSVREIPAEKTLDMIAKCMEIAGVLVDERL